MTSFFLSGRLCEEVGNEQTCSTHEASKKLILSSGRKPSKENTTLED
jgi:hypothetical protein